MHLKGIEPSQLAPEASALSTELQVHLLFYIKYPEISSAYFQLPSCIIS